jgi:predicted transcriptional regulator YdeE
MNIEIIDKPLHLNLHGFSGTAANNEFVLIAFALMNKMWETVKSNNLPNKGRNYWVFEQNGKVFVGVELTDTSAPNNLLEQKEIKLSKYAWFNHVGPYSHIRLTGQNMRSKLATQGLEVIHPYIEIYGHHHPDESKLETELIMTLGN